MHKKNKVMGTRCLELEYYIGEGLESQIFEQTNEKGTCVIKKWKEPVSMNAILYQIHTQQKCHDENISPKILEIDLSKKRISMDKLYCNLLTFFTKMKKKHFASRLDNIQYQIMDKWKTLDRLNIFHNDPNICNIMLDRDFNVKLIDFGFTITCEKKKGITNMKQNPPAFIKWIKDWNTKNAKSKINIACFRIIEKAALNSNHW